MKVTSDEFQERVAPHRRELLAHCYRMLGSVLDAEDAVQETLLRAWKALPEFEQRASFRTWLYRIATHICLDVAKRKGPRVLPDERQMPSEPETPLAPPDFEVPWLEPAPRTFWEAIPGHTDPEVAAHVKQSLGLAFLTVIQRLPPTQRAVLLLREVLGWSAAEVADLLETTVAGVNSALQRARASVDPKRLEVPSPVAAAEAKSLLARYIETWERGAPDALAQLLRDEALLTMPPIPTWFSGPVAISAFVSRILQQSGRPRVRVGEAAGGAAAAMYLQDPKDGLWRAHSLHMLEVAEGKIARIHAFILPAERFGSYGFPPTYEGPI